MPSEERRLAAIMFTDIMGFTAMTQANESRAIGLLKTQRELARPLFKKHGGTEVKTMGDGFLVEFASALAATECAIELEDAVRRYNREKNESLRVRIGIHVGDVVHSEGDVYGDAVNIASRIEPLAVGGGICVSQQAYDQVRNKVPFRFSKLEAPELKNVSIPIDVYRLEAREGEPDAEVAASEVGRRVAVLPFANMSPDPGDEYFADGMTEEMISTLSKIQGIEVISRTSVMQYKRNPKAVKQVGRELNAGTILEGSVRKAGNRLRVTVQMVDAARDRHLWAESYDRDMQDVFEIQSDIARLTADALKVKVFPSFSVKTQGRPTSSAEAYNLYLNGRFHWNRRGLDDVRKAVGYFGRAVKEDPGFALGYVGLGDCYHVLTTNFGLDAVENSRKAGEMVAKALELDPDLAEAHATRGVSLMTQFDLRGAEEEFRRAIELKPSYVSAHQWYCQLLIAQLRWDEAVSHIEKAAELDPFSHVVCLVHTFLYEAKRDFQAALGMAKKAIQLNPDDPSSHYELAWICGKLKLM
ncbi:MAG TPA: adenylate/guanylate cyclase domain-containing protein, partial [Nitrososphaerales archaeon]|nr:adenylate/guanylate cyclase domain-containing protein [Nitrososphaerales archaeon]